MTGYTVHTGSTEKFSRGWDRIFSEGTGSKKKSRKQTKKKKSAQAAAGRKKTAGKRGKSGKK